MDADASGIRLCLASCCSLPGRMDKSGRGGDYERIRGRNRCSCDRSGILEKGSDWCACCRCPAGSRRPDWLLPWVIDKLRTKPSMISGTRGPQFLGLDWRRNDRQNLARDLRAAE